jgi:hypothetical protein
MATKKTTKKKMSVGGKVLIGAAVLGGGWAAWEYIIKPLINPHKTGDDTPMYDMPTLPTKPVTNIPTGQQIDNIVSAANSVPANVGGLDVNKKLAKGSKGAEVKSAQTAFNDIIFRAGKAYALPNHGAGSVTNMFGSGQISVDRLKKLSELKQLQTDGNFGPATEAVGLAILGNTAFSLSDVRNKRAQFYAAIGLPSPY